MATAYEVYLTVLVAILVVGLAIWPVIKRLARDAGKHATVGYTIARVTSIVIISIAAIGFLFWPIAWYVHFQFVGFPKLRGGMLLLPGFLPQIVLLIVGLVYRPHRPYTRGRWSKHPPDIA